MSIVSWGYKFCTPNKHCICSGCCSGVEGGFNVNDSNIEVEEHLSIVVLPGWAQIPWPNADIPEQVCKTCTLLVNCFNIVNEII